MSLQPADHHSSTLSVQNKTPFSNYLAWVGRGKGLYYSFDLLVGLSLSLHHLFAFLSVGFYCIAFFTKSDQLFGVGHPVLHYGYPTF